MATGLQPAIARKRRTDEKLVSASDAGPATSGFSAALRRRMQPLGALQQYSKGEIVFVAGEVARGVFELQSGRIKLSTESGEGRPLILRIVEPGEIFGLAGTLTGRPRETTAEAMECSQARFIPRPAFLRLLQADADASLQAARVLGEICRAAYQTARRLGHPGSAPERLARFLLEWVRAHHGEAPLQAKLTLTHEEIGDLLGLSRETVTRMFAEFKKRNCIEVRGATLAITSADWLGSLARQ